MKRRRRRSRWRKAEVEVEEEAEEMEMEEGGGAEEEETVNFHITTDNITIVHLISFNLVYYCVINFDNV
jgi:hypothetical protein